MSDLSDSLEWHRRLTPEDRRRVLALLAHTARAIRAVRAPAERHVIYQTLKRAADAFSEPARSRLRSVASSLQTSRLADDVPSTGALALWKAEALAFLNGLYKMIAAPDASARARRRATERRLNASLDYHSPLSDAERRVVRSWFERVRRLIQRLEREMPQRYSDAQWRERVRQSMVRLGDQAERLPLSRMARSRLAHEAFRVADRLSHGLESLRDALHALASFVINYGRRFS